MNEQKIAEIICPDTRRESCDSCQRHYSIGECAKAKQIEAILALIEQEQKQSRMAGYDDGVEVGKALQSVEDEKKIKPMVEALKEVKEGLEEIKVKACTTPPSEANGFIDWKARVVLAKIDAVLKGEGK